MEKLLYAHAPATGDCLFLPAGTVHSIGGGLLLFEIQQTSDLTYRLYDWGRVDPKTGSRANSIWKKGWRVSTIRSARAGRPPQPPRAMAACGGPDWSNATISRWAAGTPTSRSNAGGAGQCRVLVGIGGRAVIQHAGKEYPIGPGDVWLLPAEVGACECVPARTRCDPGMRSRGIAPPSPEFGLMLIDLNCDLGEGAGTDDDLLPLITSANVCCGAHAGSPEVIVRTLELAATGRRHWRHPGHPDREHFGRLELPTPPDDVREQIHQQIVDTAVPGRSRRRATALRQAARGPLPSSLPRNCLCRCRAGRVRTTWACR